MISTEQSDNNKNKCKKTSSYHYDKEDRNEKIAELTILKQSLDDKNKQLDVYYDQLIHLKADFENYRKRAEKDKVNYLNIGKENIIIKQLSIFDVLEQAIDSIKLNKNVETVVDGLEMIKKEFTKMLIAEGIEEIQCLYFDPNTCEAFDYSECTKPNDEGKILKVYQKGYKMNGRLIRTAKVQIAKKIIKS
ncbi:MAG: nucleotide exchange factor GrpE [Endomicrobium sp.]|nr:nucleotide exchange factor GrpE [Endomicrobium sp.]